MSKTISNAGGTWDQDTAWAEGSKPTAADDVSATGSSGDLTIDVNTGTSALCRSLDFTGYVATFTHNDTALWIGDATPGAGNVALRYSADMDVAFDVNSRIQFRSTAATEQLIVSNGHNCANIVEFVGDNSSVGGNHALADDWQISFSLNFVRGTFNDNGHAITVGAFNSGGSGTRNLTFTGIANLTGTGTVLTVNKTNLTLDAAAWTINIADTGASSKTFAGGGASYGTVQVAMGGAGIVSFTGSNTFVRLERSGTGTKNVRFAAGSTTTITGGEDAFFSGTSGNLITIDSSSDGTDFNLTNSAGDLVSDYLSLKDCNYTGPGTFYAGSNSTDAGGNSDNIIFDDPPPPAVSGPAFPANRVLNRRRGRLSGLRTK